MLCFHFFGREVIMGRRWRFWPLMGFLTAAVLGTLAHFAYRWSGGALLAGLLGKKRGKRQAGKRRKGEKGWPATGKGRR